MSLRLRDALMRELDSLRYEPSDKRIRGQIGDVTVIDSTRALLVWEPRRVVPTYAFPVEDIDGEVAAAPPADDIDAQSAGVAAIGDAPRLAGRTVLDPSVPFSVRTTDGEPVTIRVAGGAGEAAAFRAADGALAGHLIVDFDAFDAWYEEDEPNVGHPRDPFHRIDIVRSSRHVRVEHEGTLLAESTNAHVLFEPPLPVRYYVPQRDVRMDLVRPSDKRSTCAYKGHATYWAVDGFGDVGWSYPQPLREAAEVTGELAFFNEHVDIVVDGVALERPQTPWSRR